MGDRISIQFVHKGEKSVVLFSHWSGQMLVIAAREYVKNLPKNKEYSPLDRREPNTVMVDFISRVIGKGRKIDSDFYLGATKNDGDNSDNGHFLIDLEDEND